MTIVLNGTTRPPPASARRVVVVLSHLGPGGAERVVSSMTAYWVERGYDVTVVTLSDTTADFYRLDRCFRHQLLLPRPYLVLTPVGKPPPMAVRLAKVRPW